MTNTSCQGASTPGYDPAPYPRQIQESDDGVDVTLIRWMLSLSPTQRLEVFQNTVDSLTELCDAVTTREAGRAQGSRRRQPKPPCGTT